MDLVINWLGHASFRLQGAGSVVYIDPWKLCEAPHDADVIFVSHDHHDHCSPDDIAKVARENTVLVAPVDTLGKIGQGQAVAPDEQTAFGEVVIETVASYNVGKAFHPKGNHWCGAVFTLAGKRVYYAGDTDLIPEMNDLHDVDLALLPVGGTYTLTAAEAARATERIGCAHAVPYHWGDIVGSLADAEQFARQAACEVTILQPGESMSR